MGVIAEEAVKIRADTSGFHSDVSRSVMGSVLKIGAAAGAALGGLAIGKALFVDPIKSAGDFQKSLDVLRATSGATDAQMKKISATAMKLGADVKLPAVSASDAANAMLELAKGGFTAQQSMDAARGTLLLSTAAEIDGAEAARLVADSLHAFGLEASQAGKVVDDFAGAANASTASMSEVAQALQQSGQAFHQLGIPIGDATTAIAAMANAGIKGSDAGTSLKTMLARLHPETTKAKAAFAAMNVDVFDQQGKFIGLEATIKQFQPRLAGMTMEQKQHALATIFGSDASRAAAIVLGQSAKKFDELRDKVTKAGQAQKLADAQTKGFNGQMKALGSAIETLQLKLGLKMLPVLARFVGFLAKVAGAPNFNVAIKVAWEGIQGFAANVAKTIGDALFGSTRTVHIGGGATAGTAVVVDPGLIANIQRSIGDGIAATNWAAVGKRIGDAISSAIKVSSNALEGVLDGMMTWLDGHKDQIAEVGLVIGLTMLSKLLDPSFWFAHWQLIGGIALSAITILFPEGKLAQIGIKALGFLLKPFAMLGTRLLAVGTEGVLRLASSIESAIGPLGGRIALWLGSAILRATSAAVSGMVRLGAALITALINKISGLGVLFRTAAFTAIVAVIGNLLGAAVTAAANLAVGIAKAIMGLPGKLVDLHNQLGKAVVGALNSLLGSARDAAVNVAERIAAGIKTAPGKLAGLAGDLAGRIAGVASQVAGSAFSFMREIGFRIADGIISGVGNLASRLGSVITGAIAHAKGLVKIANWITSPSRLWAVEIGAPIGAGVVAGVQASLATLGTTTVTTLAGIRTRLRTISAQLATDIVGVSKDAAEKLVAKANERRKDVGDAFGKWAENAKARFDAGIASLVTSVDAQFAKAQAKIETWKAKATPTEALLASRQALAAYNQVQLAVGQANAALANLKVNQAKVWGELMATQAANMATLRASLQESTDSALLTGNTFTKNFAAQSGDPIAMSLIAAQKKFDATKVLFDQGLVSQAEFIAAADALEAAKLAASEDTNAQTLLDQYNTWQAALKQQTEAGVAITTQQATDFAAREALQQTFGADLQTATAALNEALLGAEQYANEQKAAAERTARDARAEAMNTELVTRHNRILVHLGNVQHAWDLHFNELARMGTAGGDNLTQNLAKALRDGIPTVAGAAAAVAGVIAQHLKVKSPTEKGPMSDLDSWWQRLAPTLIQSLDTSMVKAALTDATTPSTGARPSITRPDAPAGGPMFVRLEDATSRDLADLVRFLRRDAESKTTPAPTNVEVHVPGVLGVDAAVYRSRR